MQLHKREGKAVTNFQRTLPPRPFINEIYQRRTNRFRAPKSSPPIAVNARIFGSGETALVEKEMSSISQLFNAVLSCMAVNVSGSVSLAHAEILAP